MSNSKKDILGYASRIWSTADTLRGVGIKGSDFPKYMMPFFALMLLESRMVRMKREKEQDKSLSPKALLEEIKEEGKGYNEVILKQGTLIKDICANDRTFEQDFHKYLQAFDQETKELLGIVYAEGNKKFLDLKGMYEDLKSSKVGFSFVRQWAMIDLIDFNNSDVTTLEEHIKQKWSDISADTAGEQYTPEDIIQLNAALANSKLKNSKKKVLNVYDMTCGGGNMLFGVADKLQDTLGNKVAVNTYGQELNPQLYALAKIESRFREGSNIEMGNTLTNDKFPGIGMDVMVANPPYGVDWKEVEKDIKNDKTGRYKAGLPTTADGQLLFMQHGAFKINEQKRLGLAYVVLNGSPMFSGDAGGGESNIRKYFLDNDLVEAFIQLPKDEFFNTNITTYLWCLNWNKPEERKDKILLINAENMFTSMKKSKGKKNKEIDLVNREKIVKLYEDFKETEISKVMSRFNFYYNSQSLELLNTDSEGKSIVDWDEKIVVKELEEVRGSGKTIKARELSGSTDKDLKAEIKEFRELMIDGDLEFVKDGKVVLSSKDGVVSYDGKKGRGRIDFTAKANKKEKTVSLEVLIKADIEKDYEVIPYCPDPKDNDKKIATFMKEWVERPYKLTENTVGVEVNFNKIFYSNESSRSIKVVLNDLKKLQEEIEFLEKGLE